MSIFPEIIIHSATMAIAAAKMSVVCRPISAAVKYAATTNAVEATPAANPPTLAAAAVAAMAFVVRAPAMHRRALFPLQTTCHRGRCRYTIMAMLNSSLP